MARGRRGQVRLGRRRAPGGNTRHRRERPGGDQSRPLTPSPSAARRPPETIDELRAPVPKRERERFVVEQGNAGVANRLRCGRVDLAVADDHAALGRELDGLLEEPRHALFDRAEAGGVGKLVHGVRDSVDQPEAIRLEEREDGRLVEQVDVVPISVDSLGRGAVKVVDRERWGVEEAPLLPLTGIEW
jgi:hypothetical protein